MKHLFSLFVIAVSIFYCSTSAFSQKEDAHNISFGLAGSFGMFNAFSTDDDMSWNMDYGWGAGFIVEKMFSSHFGIHSGFWYTDARIGFDSNSDGFVTTDAYTQFSSISMPLDVISSFNISFFSVNFLSGITFAQIMESKMYYTDAGVEKTVDVLYDMNYFQFGINLGLTFKFRVGKFTDIFFGEIFDLYLLDTVQDSNNGKSNLYDLRSVAGFLFRTDVFPF